jgi:hypothetical protein
MAGTIRRGKAVRADLALWDGVNKTASRIDATGGTITGVTIGDEVDVLQVYGGGSSRTVQAITDATAKVGSSSLTLLFSTGTWMVDSNVTIPSNVTCRIPRGCVFNISSGVTLTINGDIDAGLYQIFSGSGSVSAPNAKDAPPNWWGAALDGSTDDTTAIGKWIDLGISGASLFLPEGEANCSTWTTKTTSATLRIRGEGRSRSKITGPGTSTTSQSFIKSTGSLFIDGVKTHSFYYVHQIGALSSEVEIEITNCGNTDSLYHVVRESADCNSVGVKSFLYQGNDVNHSGIATSTATRGVFLQGPYTDARVIGNKFQSVRGRAIVLGHNENGDQDVMIRASVIGNTIKDIDGQSGQETQAILVYGRNAAIIGNVIEDVTSAASSNCEGIYTKCRYATIVGNTLYDAGFDEAAINIKGSARAGTSSPQGYAVICAHNNIYFSSSTTTKGIHIQNEDVLVEGNHIEGAGLDGIYSKDLTLNNVTIRNNRIINCSSQRAIFIQHNGTGLYITGNEIIELDTRNTITDTIALYIIPTSAALNDVDIISNTVRIDAGSEASTSVRAIHIARSNEINNLRIIDNHLSVTNTVTTYGVSLAGTAGGENWTIRGNDWRDVDENQFEITAGTMPASFDFDGYFTKQTTDSPQTTCGPNFTLADNCAVTFDAEVIAMQSDGSNRNLYHDKGLFYRDGGGATQQGSTANLITPIESAAGWAFNLGTNGNDIRALVTGAAATTIDWRARLKLSSIG